MTGPNYLTAMIKLNYDLVRAGVFGGKITQSQVDGAETILKAIVAAGISDLRWAAYMLATAYWETGKTLQPISEYGRGAGRKYGSKIKMSGVGYAFPDRLYYGRGYVQLTWFENYKAMGGLILLSNPELALDPTFAAFIMIEGMTRGNSSFGDFTGKSLEDYFNKTTTDWINARKIINGLDQAPRIAGYAQSFYKALTIT